MVKHTQTIHELLPTNYLSVFHHFVGLAFKGLNSSYFFIFKVKRSLQVVEKLRIDFCAALHCAPI